MQHSRLTSQHASISRHHISPGLFPRSPVFTRTTDAETLIGVPPLDIPSIPLVLPASVRGGSSKGPSTRHVSFSYQTQRQPGWSTLWETIKLSTQTHPVVSWDCRCHICLGSEPFCCERRICSEACKATYQQTTQEFYTNLKGGGGAVV